MPELPETETIARELNERLAGRTIGRVIVHRPDVIRGTAPQVMARRLRGAVVRGSWRRAKCIIVDLSTGDRLVIQPRFTGGIRVQDGILPPTAESVAVHVELIDGGSFSYVDVRRLGTVSLVDPKGFTAFSARLGLEPLDATFGIGELSDFLRASSQSVKKVLMDQRRIAGIGNIYANEALWRAGVDPSKVARRVDRAAVAKLHDAVVSVLGESIRMRGTTFRDYRDASGRRGNFAGRLAVYGRSGEPCKTCGTRIALTHAIDGRSTYFCFRCQR